MTTSSSSALFDKGFRPFFLLAGSFAVAMLPMWLLVLNGTLSLEHGLFPPLVWHAHEMVFGFTVAVIAGFLLTAVGNWTQRETLVRAPLFFLCALWLLGRLAVAFPALFFGSRIAAAAIDLAFLPTLIAVLARPLIQAKNKRNFVMLVILALLFGANVMTHFHLDERKGALIAVDVIVVLMLVISGRVIPMFTRNATRVQSIKSGPAALDAIAVGSMALVTMVDVVTSSFSPSLFSIEQHPFVEASLTGLAGVSAVARMARWGTRHSLRQPLVWILHVGYLWIPIGLLLRAASVSLGSGSGAIPSSLATHAFTAGAIGSLTLGMMARVSLGHTGRVLSATPAVSVSFVLISLAAALRVLAPLLFGVAEHYFMWLVLAGSMWTAGFAIFLFEYGRILVTPRLIVSTTTAAAAATATGELRPS